MKPITAAISQAGFGLPAFPMVQHKTMMTTKTATRAFPVQTCNRCSRADWVLCHSKRWAYCPAGA